jgi:hypothetical protein
MQASIQRPVNVAIHVLFLMLRSLEHGRRIAIFVLTGGMILSATGVP